MPGEQDISRLPKWAQRIIEGKQSRIDSLESELASYSSGSATGTSVESYTGDGIHLPRESRVRFDFGPFGNWLEVHRVREGDGERLEVRSDWSRIVVEPRACNTVHVRIARDG